MEFHKLCCVIWQSLPRKNGALVITDMIVFCIFFPLNLLYNFRGRCCDVQTSPADGKVLYCGEVEHGMLEQVKGVSYSLVGFLGPFETLFPGSDKDVMDMYDFTDYHCLMSNPLNKLYHCIIYLAPGDYHRFHSPADWSVFLRRYFPGEFHHHTAFTQIFSV